MKNSIAAATLMVLTSQLQTSLAAPQAPAASDLIPIEGVPPNIYCITTTETNIWTANEITQSLPQVTSISPNDYEFIRGPQYLFSGATSDSNFIGPNPNFTMTYTDACQVPQQGAVPGLYYRQLTHLEAGSKGTEDVVVFNVAFPDRIMFCGVLTNSDFPGRSDGYHQCHDVK